MLLRNLNPSHGECNGTRMVCRQFQKNVILAEITMGQFTGNLVPLPRIPLSPAENEGYPFHLKREQFPIRLSFAMTINKAQGQTIPHVGVYLPESVFSHGQLYVALSRGISMSTTKVLVKDNKEGKKTRSYTRNVVYKEVLLPRRLPMELGCSQSLMPLHNITASALFISILSLKSGNWGRLSEDFSFLPLRSSFGFVEYLVAAFVSQR
ncbi:ATP-dependent DNA helicase PIF6-like [Macadamia integrifolia]|uniref:ATP-dependent DNA helicase PIF6-like n=1 Tax=Macadamia integrifolia TaxID=60698 RepID=UPI001C4E36B9|nr:ATP-dependent DNA helicase PIF6-like [Macadamia integrifolia]XP_042504704.1 ATP-dependent DNA helicase PIF6-like [Macadamia integrifolia]